MKSKWWEEKAIERLLAANRRDMKSFYKRSFLHGPKSKGMIQLRYHNGTTFLHEKRNILKSLSDQLHKLFNIPGELDEAAKKVAKVTCCT